MLAPAQRHFVEEALDAYQDTLIEWFPACFHWARFCADAPAMAARVSGRPGDEDDVGLEYEIRARAERVFCFAHVATLAVLSCAGVHEGDPGEALEQLVDEPDASEEAFIEELVATVLEPLERTLAGDEGVDFDERGEAAYSLLYIAWPAVEVMLEEDGILGEIEQPVPGADAEHRAAVRSVLGSIALVAAILATFRWISVGQTPAEDLADDMA